MDVALDYNFILINMKHKRKIYKNQKKHHLLYLEAIRIYKKIFGIKPVIIYTNT